METLIVDLCYGNEYNVQSWLAEEGIKVTGKGIVWTGSLLFMSIFTIGDGFNTTVFFRRRQK